VFSGSILPNKAILFYRETTDDSKILRSPISLYEAWNKPEEAEGWRAKSARMGDFEE
jgi:hypothetical protein